MTWVAEDNLPIRLLPGLERRLKAEQVGEVRFDAFTRGRYATDASHYQIMPLGVVTPRTIEEAERAIGDLPRGRRAGDAARRRHLAGRADRQRRAGRRLLAASQPRARSRRRRPALHGRAGHRARRAQPPAEAARAVVPGRYLDRVARHHRRHGRQQFLRRALAALRQYARERAVDRCHAGRRHARAFRPDAATAGVNVPPRSGARPARHRARARPTRSSGAFRKCSAASAATISTRWCPARNDINLAHLLVGSEGTLAFSTKIELKLSPLLGRRAVGACHFGSFHEAMEAAQHIVTLGPIAVELIDRTMLGLAARHRDVPADRRRIPARRSGGDPVRRIRRGRLGRKSAPPEAARRIARRSRHRLGPQRRQVGRRRRGARSKAASRHHRSAHRRPQHHDVDEGGRQAGLLRRGLRGAAGASRRLHRAADRDFREATARAAPGMRMPRSAACMCGRCSTCGSTRTCARCAPSPRKPSPWCANTRARIPASMATASCARNSMRRCSAPARARLRGGEGPLRSARPVQSRQDRARAEIRRPRHFALRPGLSRRGDRQRARLVGLFGRRRRFPGRGRDVQQQRRLPRARGRRHVPELPRHPRRARRHARPRQHAAPRHHRPARPGCAHLRRDGGDAEALRLLQGLPARMPDRRRHGAHEDRGFARAEGKIRPVAARPAGRLSAALCASAAKLSVAAEFARRVPGAGQLSEAIAGFSARRSLPKWRADCFDEPGARKRAGHRREVVLFADTFNRYFERENIDAALAVLAAAGYRVTVATPADGTRPLCCGRTFLAVGKVDEARREAERTLAALAPFAAAVAGHRA